MFAIFRSKFDIDAIECSVLYCSSYWQFLLTLLYSVHHAISRVYVSSPFLSFSIEVEDEDVFKDYEPEQFAKYDDYQKNSKEEFEQGYATLSHTPSARVSMLVLNPNQPLTASFILLSYNFNIYLVKCRKEFVIPDYSFSRR